MKTSCILAFAAILAAPVPALAQQSGGTAPAEPVTQQQSEAAAIDTETFVKQAASANKFEIDSSKIALERAQNADVKAFAQKMVDDHTNAGMKMKEALTTAGMAMPAEGSDKLEAKHQTLLDGLTDTGSSFDAAYVAAQTQAHREAVQLFTQYSKSGDNETIRTWATETLPALEQHLAAVEKLPGSAVDATGAVTTPPAAPDGSPNPASGTSGSGTGEGSEQK